MSLDAVYILSYDNLSYKKPTPMETDVNYLKEKYGGTFVFIQECTIFWDKPKYTLLPDDISQLMADQVLEKRDCEQWEVIYPRFKCFRCSVDLETYARLRYGRTICRPCFRKDYPDVNQD